MSVVAPVVDAPVGVVVAAVVLVDPVVLVAPFAVVVELAVVVGAVAGVAGTMAAVVVEAVGAEDDVDVPVDEEPGVALGLPSDAAAAGLEVVLRVGALPARLWRRGVRGGEPWLDACCRGRALSRTDAAPPALGS
ncbi:MAG: hypothetical protein ACJ780_02440 [Solirubrobacteraceae bacterium]